MDCPGCGEPITDIAETTDHIDIMVWGVKKPRRQLERSTLYCPLCDRVFVTNVADVTPSDD